jgi:hypothetical protein
MYLEWFVKRLITSLQLLSLAILVNKVVALSFLDLDFTLVRITVISDFNFITYFNQYYSDELICFQAENLLVV